MRWFHGIGLGFLLMSKLCCNAAQVLQRHDQLLVVIGDDWEKARGVLQGYERSTESSAWAAVGLPMPVVLGKTGLAWGT